jgi:hypothetical protein
MKLNKMTRTNGGKPTSKPLQTARVNRNQLLVTIGAICLLTVAGVSSSGRSAVRSFLSFVVPFTTPAPEAIPAAIATAPDTEQRARARHGWNPGIVNSVVRGTITYFDSDGADIAPRAGFALYQKYGEGLRVELDRGAAVEVSGFDQVRAWKAVGKVSDEEARAIRAWMRLWPERLFVTRASGAAYREAGRRIEDGPDGMAVGQPQGGTALFDEVEIEDVIGPSPSQGHGDRRSISYYVSQERSTVEAIRWLEPDDSRKSIDDEAVGLIDVRVDFADWREVSGVLWPFAVTRSYGGRPEFRIMLSEVKVNQPLGETIFHGK